MNPHYLELMEYLELLSKHPEHILDPEHCVFASESLLYSSDPKFNHRLHKKYLVVRQSLYTHDEFDDEVLDMVKTAAISMADKIQAYKSDHLPGGELWNPSEKVKSLLFNLEPTNDMCESILGLNDWLQKSTQNLSQRTVTTMVEVMRNATMPWFLKQEKAVKDDIITLARQKVHRIKQEYNRKEEERRLQRKRTREESRPIRVWP